MDGLDATANTIVCWARPTTGAEGGVYRTTNALTTATFTNTLAQASTTITRGEVASVTIGGVTTMYLAAGETGVQASPNCKNANQGAVRKSTDGGATWGARLDGGSGFCGGQCF